METFRRFQLSAAELGVSLGISGSIDLFWLNNSARSVVQDKAQLAAKGGDVAVTSSADATMINVSGMALSADQLKDLNPGIEANTSIGGSLMLANLHNTSEAHIGDGTKVSASGHMKVNSETDTLAIDIVQAGDKAEKFGVTGAFALNDFTTSAQAYIQSNAAVNAGSDVNVGATSGLTEVTVGGALGLGGSGQVGVTANWNKLDATTRRRGGDRESVLADEQQFLDHRH